MTTVAFYKKGGFWKNAEAERGVSECAREAISFSTQQPSLDMLMLASDKQRNYLGHMEVHRVTRQFLLQCVKPAPESPLGDVPDLDIYV